MRSGCKEVRASRFQSDGHRLAIRAAGDLTAVERLQEGETPVIAESFAYDGGGLMASRTVGLTTRHLVWDVTEAPESLLSDGKDSYIYGPGGLAFEQISRMPPGKPRGLSPMGLTER